jgi:N-acetylglucosamine repressor
MANFNYDKRKTNTSSKPKNIKQHNQKLIISLLQGGDVYSTTELGERSNLSKTAVSRILSDLRNMGLVCSVGKGSSTNEGGKKPELYALNANLRCIIVLSLAEKDFISCSVLDLSGKLKYNKSSFLHVEISYEEIIQLMSTLINDAMQALSLLPDSVCGISVAYNGIVNTSTGEILYPTGCINTVNRTLRDDLTRELPFACDIIVDNTCRFSGYAELMFEDNRRIDNLVVICTDQTTNGCILIDQKFVAGHKSYVGEFGHLIIDPTSSINCFCGRKGCLESLISRNAIVELAVRMSTGFLSSPVAQRVIAGSINSVNAEEIFKEANNGESFSQCLLNRIVEYFTILIHNIALLNNTKKFILQGMYASAGDYFLQRLNKNVHSFSRFKIHNDIQIAYSQFESIPKKAENDPVVLGAGFYTSTQYMHNLIELGRQRV